MKKYFLAILTLLGVSVNVAIGQEGACGTQITDNQKVLESQILIQPQKAIESIKQLNTELCIEVYIVKDQSGNTGITTAAIQTAMNKVNQAFDPVKLKFKICNFRYVDNYQFNNLNASNNQKDLFIQNNTKNTINLYFTSEVIDINGNLVSGYAFMPSEGKDAIFMDKDFIHTTDLVHQFGHFFNLYHTHETVFGKELVKDIDCNKSGDKCCDTPADPGIASAIDEKCDYTGNMTDTDKNFYIPSTNNFMSLGNENCRCVFTNDQYNRIIFSFLNHKKHLW